MTKSDFIKLMNTLYNNTQEDDYAKIFHYVHYNISIIDIKTVWKDAYLKNIKDFLSNPLSNRWLNCKDTKKLIKLMRILRFQIHDERGRYIEEINKNKEDIMALTYLLEKYLNGGYCILAGENNSIKIAPFSNKLVFNH